MDRLVIIDGHAILHRAFHALPPLTTSKGIQVNAVYGFISILLRVVNDLKPVYLVVVFDTPKPTFRNKLSKTYQANRPKTDEKLIPQFDLVHKVVDEMGVNHFETDGFEADDVIGTIVEKVKSQKSPPKADQPLAEKVKNTNQNSKIEETETIIVTGDRDLMQLVDDKVKVYMPVKGLSESKLYGEKEVEEKMGVKPSQIIDLKALTGDSSDNYRGVGGVGPKTATDLLKTYGDFKGIYRNLEKIKGKSVKEKLEKGRKSGELSLQLATIVKEVPVEFKMEDCKLESFDNANVRWMLEDFEFKSLIPRLVSANTEQKDINIKQKTEKTENNQISLF